VRQQARLSCSRCKAGECELIARVCSLLISCIKRALRSLEPSFCVTYAPIAHGGAFRRNVFAARILVEEWKS
jgi:hypothetical protein